MIEVRDLQVRYGTRVVARVPELDVGAGECVAIVGESGSGKSTTLLSLLGLTEGADVSGHVSVCGVEVLQASPQQLRRIRGARVALVLQSPQAALSPTTRLGTLMRRALALHGITGPRGGGPETGGPETGGSAGSRKERSWKGRASKGGLERVMVEAVEAVMLDPEILRRYPHEISGGQAQRFSIALAIALGAEVILADEPTSALDVTVQAEVVGVLHGLREERGLALLIVSHDLALVSTIADRVLVMKDGEVVESGPAADVLTRPAHPYTRELLEALP
ncbi:ABC transporter ATP-binding protein [Nonomuraea glycinis]|uniref:ABC transporter ATP-binding protein n=1 Tax=Nonomuraea glycinis TaxID=2047744 RepID=UPI0033A36EEA